MKYLRNLMVHGFGNQLITQLITHLVPNFVDPSFGWETSRWCQNYIPRIHHVSRWIPHVPWLPSNLLLLGLPRFSLTRVFCVFWSCNQCFSQLLLGKVFSARVAVAGGVLGFSWKVFSATVGVFCDGKWCFLWRARRCTLLLFALATCYPPPYHPRPNTHYNICFYNGKLPTDYDLLQYLLPNYLQHTTCYYHILPTITTATSLPFQKHPARPDQNNKPTTATVGKAGNRSTLRLLPAHPLYLYYLPPMNLLLNHLQHMTYHLLPPVLPANRCKKKTGNCCKKQRSEPL